MNKQTIQASGFGKKTYAKPQMKAYQVKPSSIICTSGEQGTKAQDLGYDTEYEF